MANHQSFEPGETVKIIKHREGKSQALGVVKDVRKNEVWVEVQKHRSTHPYVIKVPLSKVRKCLTRKRVERNGAETVETETVKPTVENAETP